MPRLRMRKPNATTITPGRAFTPIKEHNTKYQSSPALGFLSCFYAFPLEVACL